VAIKSHPVDRLPAPEWVPEPEWRIEPALVEYQDAVLAMEQRVAAIRAGTAPELVWLLEHPPVYTAGTSADPAELLHPGSIPVIATGRGGRHTYHGPGQRVTYVMADLRRRGQDVRRFVHALEEWAIQSLALLGVGAERRQGRVGIWVPRGDGREDKIVAIGVRVRGWVSYHGLAINVNPDLGAFSGIVPCGIADRQYGVTSLADLGIAADMATVDAALKQTFAQAFAP
jgi:lipoyl(octanoyl) transferase